MAHLALLHVLCPVLISVAVWSCSVLWALVDSVHAGALSIYLV